MRTAFRSSLVLLASGAAFAAPALALDPSIGSNFNDGTLQGWGGGASPTIMNGGPAGPSDKYLRITADGITNLAATNSAAHYLGNYAGNFGFPGQYLILGIMAEMANFGPDPVTMRAIFFNTNTNRYSTTDSAVIPADSTWRMYAFMFDPTNGAGLTAVAGTVPVTTGMQNVTQIMFRHNPTPAAGVSVNASLGLDNIGLIPFIPAPSAGCAVLLGGALLARRRR